MAVVDNGGWLPDKESMPDDIEVSTARFERWKGRRQLLITLILFASLVLLITLVTGAFIYIHYIPHQVKPKIPQKTCEKMYCSYGALCQVDYTTQQAYCRCQESCSELFAPVCGTDGITYSSECQVKMASCTQQQRILVHHQGHCDAKDPCEEKECPFGSRCRPGLDGRTAECVCPDKCATYGDSRGSRPVCGTDGRDYPNDCELRRTSCKEMRDIGVKFQGRCDPCQGIDCSSTQVCQLDEHRNPVCRCNDICSPDMRPVCGSDGKTYANECALRVEACRSRKSLRIIYTGECSTGANPCKGISCGPGEECDINRYGIATCQCPSSCEAVMRPVCGSDGRSYHNECELIKQSCLYRKNIVITYRGECGERGPCHKHDCAFGSVCVIKSGYAVCECASCTEEFEPVCGTDGISYTNICKLNRESCEQKINIDVAHHGLCNGCQNKRCEFYAICEEDEKKEAHCVCPHSCIKVESTVCGTDGITYLNECEMRVAACNKQQSVVVGTRGSCDLCQNTQCKFGSRCENGQCVCPSSCPDLYEPVCALDGTTHFNECKLRRSACVQSKENSVLFYGECADVSSSGQDLNAAAVGCQEKTCSFGSTCDYDADGSAVCVCNFDCPNSKDPVCGSDGVVHANDCYLKSEACRQQQQIYILPMSMCEVQPDFDEVPCDGEMPLQDPFLGGDYFCGEGLGAKPCPPSSYCHRRATFAKCCRGLAMIKSCADTAYGCCPDEKTPSLGPNFAGCPSICNCNRLGSYGLSCDAENLQCSCKPGVGGLRCDRCEPGYWGLHKATEGISGCTSCSCNMLGSVRDDCEQMTGRCVCKQGIKGMKCDTCPQGTVLGPTGCTDASISVPISGSCSDMVCLYAAVCKERNDDGLQAQCVCDIQCSADRENSLSVCGSDGNTYGSECQMRHFGCRYQKLISITNEGPCKRGNYLGEVHDVNATPGPVRRSTVHRVAPAASTDIKSTRNVALSSEFYQLTTRPTLTTSTEFRIENAIEIPSFSGRSFLELPRIEAYARLSVELEFQTFANEGIILYNGQTPTGEGDFVSLTLKDGFVEFRYDVGNGPIILRSPEKLNLGKYHRLVAKRYLREGLLTLDGQKHVIGSSSGSLKSLDLSENLFLGYIPSGNNKVFDNIAVREGMVGCIRRLKIDQKEINLRFSSSTDIIRANNIHECQNNLCNASVCRNNAVCEQLNERDGWKCSCSPGYTGFSCETALDPCLYNPCPHGLRCVILEGNSFTCKCSEEFNNIICAHGYLDELEENFHPDFDGQSYLEFPPVNHLHDSFVIEMWFLTRSPDGTLLYTGHHDSGSGDFLAITLQDGYVHFRFDLGSSRAAESGFVNIKSLEAITLNEWHTVRVSRLKKNGSLQVDNGTIVTAEAYTSLTELNVGLNLYVGGVPDVFSVNPKAMVQCGLNGALQRISINEEPWTDLFATATWSHRVNKYRGPPCGGPTARAISHYCINGGICVPQLNQVICRCPPNYWGSKCENEVARKSLNKLTAFNEDTYLDFSARKSNQPEN